ncbi:TPA: hypothetical protein RM800_004338 [Yersinia enterocolitica]|uniref:hypothetical protein n=1 Tax=Yersinia enterocolitica TaxID=630 RepID=UPI0002E9C400|nr:hypothetical protein [Yersinia enterocolitica]EKN5913141.1 hypothetical protein [Yersinia enterocolitica]HDW8044231.1 hypothetical protein [Yersinia enterocolitica]HEF7271892.1 hypothetical protein [Yersinia enterocolitica]HEI6726707.1 hypothetical protein [Yersinia enterocolitica]HEI6762633.1 hypothetical protein [Yersinia enterocolitica]
MNITFTPQPIPELALASGALGFATGTPLQLTLQHHQLWITVVIDEATREAQCEASQHRPDLGADWVRENGEVIGGDWLSEFAIIDAEQLDITAAPGVLRLQRREGDIFRA